MNSSSSNKSECKRRILIVDDQTLNRRMLARILEKEGFNVTEAETGQEALAQIARHKDSPFLDLVLLDYHLQEMKGDAICREIRTHFSHAELPILFITLSSDEETTIEAFEAGANDYLTKPFRKNILLARVRTQLQLKESRENLRATNRMLQKSNEEQDKVFSILAHDLRSPIAGLSGMMDILSDDSYQLEPTELKEIHKELRNATHALKSKLEGLLQWSRWKVNAEETFAELAPTDLFESVAAEFSDVIQERQLSLSVQSSIDTVRAPKESISIVVRELLANAIQFSPVGGRIIAQFQLIDSTYQFILSDEGQGLSESARKKFQAGEYPKSTQNLLDKAGSGIGLMWIRDVLILLNGDLAIGDSPLKGATFIASWKAN